MEHVVSIHSGSEQMWEHMQTIHTFQGWLGEHYFLFTFAIPLLEKTCELPGILTKNFGEELDSIS